VTRLSRLFAVTRAGFYAWRERPASARARQDRVVLEEIRVIFERSGGTYGSPRVHRALIARGRRLSRRRVERLMRAQGWRDPERPLVNAIVGPTAQSEATGVHRVETNRATIRSKCLLQTLVTASLRPCGNSPQMPLLTTLLSAWCFSPRSRLDWQN